MAKKTNLSKIKADELASLYWKNIYNKATPSERETYKRAKKQGLL